MSTIHTLLSLGLEVKEEQTIDNILTEIAKVYRAAKEDLAMRGNNAKHRVIKEEELDRYLKEGCELVNVLKSGKLVIKQVT